MAENILEATNISHAYETGHPVLNEINFALEKPKAVAIQGPSGVGKTTLLEILGTMRSPGNGTVKIMGTKVYNHGAQRQSQLRGRWLGFVFQESLLLPDLSLWENCRLAVSLAGRTWSETKIRNKFIELMERLGLDPERCNNMPAQLSTGQRQRVAVVRALIHEPKLIFADEPTGNLDNESSEKLLNLLLPLVNKHDAGIIVATHDPVMAQSIKENYYLEDCKLKIGS